MTPIKFKEFLEASAFDDMFSNDSFSKRKLINTEDKISPYTLILYRGFDGDFSKIKQDNNNHYILSPSKSEQGMIWFTHQFINGYDPIEYAKNHGEWLLTYPLEVKKHITTEYFDDGHTLQTTPEYFRKLVQPTENAKFYRGIELPEGWVFAYKHEKFIGTTMKITVKKDQIVSSKLSI